MKRAASMLFAIALLLCVAWMWRSHGRHADAAATRDQLSTAKLVARKFYGRRLEPAENVLLHGGGQSDEESFNNYTAAVAPAKPMLTMKYVDLRDDLGQFFTQLHRDLDSHRESLVPQIGLALNRGSASKHYEMETARGMDDGRLQALCAGLQSLQRPVFVRIGYEFNAPWNGYDASTYRSAFRNVAQQLHACSPMIAVVWNWSARAELDRQRGGEDVALAASRWREYYPGDDVVDWWAINLFKPEEIGSPLTAEFLRAADKARFPVMIAESTPRNAGVRGGQLSVDAWFASYFGLLRSSPGIKAFCYIDWEWSRFPQWADWGDGRIEDNDVVMGFYRDQIEGHALFANARDRAATLQLLRVKTPR
ncbi:MAG: hypothetical protein PW792_13405 [Acidobacteriaceae bacterium]|nr:hypothetical protein [Acidobacteriaceae bacterium]